MAKNWIKGAIKHPGALHSDLGVPQGQKIPAKKLARATHSSNPTIRKRAALAKTLKGFHRADGGGIDEGIDVSDSGPTQYPYGLGQKMQYERSKMDREEAERGERFIDYGSRIPGAQKARNDAYMKRLKGPR